MDTIQNHQTTWHLLNIKARRNQNTNHYVQTFRNLKQQDPLVNIPRERCESLKSMDFSQSLDTENEPKWIKITLLSYTIINPTEFYNKRAQKNVDLNWNSDIVANKKEAELYFIPSVHTLAVRCNSDITLPHIVTYFAEALNHLEPESFDVNIIVEHDILNRILTAHAVLRIKANISYSNHGHTSGFIETFDEKLRGMDPNDFTVTAKGTKDHPLKNEEDGMLRSIINMSERDGSVEATIQSTEGSRFEKIISKDHPKKLTIPQIVNGISSTIYNTLKALFGN